MRFPDDVPTLSRGDVTLRPHRPEDAPFVVEQCVDQESLLWTTVPLGYTLEMGQAFVTQLVPAGWQSEHDLAFAIECTHPDGVRRFGGTLSLRDAEDRRAELAFGAHPAVRGRGVMTAAVGLLLDWGFAERDLETVLWMANAGNLASRRVAWRTGFAFGGTLPRWLLQRGEYLDAWTGVLHRADSREPKTRWLRAPELIGDRVRLRPLRADDASRIAEACADERTQHWLPMLPSPYDESHARSFLLGVELAMAEGRQVQWAMTEVGRDDLMGVVGFPRMEHAAAEIGYWTHPQGRGRGLMGAAVGRVVDHAFAPEDSGGLGLRRLFVRAAEGNAASAHVARSQGFVDTGRERGGQVLRNGTVVDMRVFDRLASEEAR